MEKNNEDTLQKKIVIVENRSSIKSKTREFIEFIVITALIVLPLRFFIAQPFIVSGASMDTTFVDGQYLIVDELSYRFNEPERGDVVIFRYPETPTPGVKSTFYIKRIIGLPGETVIADGTKTTIINKDHPQGFVLNEPYVSSISDRRAQATLGAGEYFVMGDNRLVSSDSRIWGVMKKDHIVGRAIVRLFPFNTASIFPGKATY